MKCYVTTMLANTIQYRCTSFLCNHVLRLNVQTL